MLSSDSHSPKRSKRPPDARRTPSGSGPVLKKRYATSKSQLRKSLGFQLDFKSLMTDDDTRQSTKEFQQRRLPRSPVFNNKYYEQIPKLPIEGASSFTGSSTPTNDISDIGNKSRNIDPLEYEKPFETDDKDTVSIADTVNQRAALLNVETPYVALNNKVAEIVASNDPEVLKETKRLSYLVLDLRKSLMSDFADPNYNSLDPTKTYDIKALNTQRPLAADNTSPAINQLLNVLGDNINTHKDKKPFIFSKATLMRSERVKANLSAYYLLMEKYQQPFTVSRSDLKKHHQEDIYDPEHTIKITLQWNPLQIIRNRKIMRKSETVPDKAYLNLHPLASSAFSSHTKRRLIWEIDNSEIGNNYHWSRKYWYLLKDSRNRLVYSKYLNEESSHHRRVSSSLSSRRNSGLFYRNAPLLNHLGSIKKSENGHSNNSSSGSHLPFGKNGSGSESSKANDSSFNRPSVNTTNSYISNENLFHSPQVNVIEDTEPMIYINDQPKKLDVSNLLKKLQNKSFVKSRLINKINKSRESHTSSSRSNGKSNEAFGKSSDILNKSNEGLDFEHSISYEQSPVSYADNSTLQPTLEPKVDEINYLSPNVLGNVSIEPISRKYHTNRSSISSAGNGSTAESSYLTKDYNQDYSNNYLSPFTSSTGKALNFDDNYAKMRESNSLSTTNQKDPKIVISDQIRFTNASFLLLNYHMGVQQYKYKKLFELEKENLPAGSGWPDINCGPLSLFKERYDKATASFKFVTSLIPIYLKAIAKETDRLGKIKSKINSNHSDKIDMLLSLSDRLISNINTKLSITLKSINEKAEYVDNTSMIAMKKNDLGFNKFLFAALEYFIIGLLYLTWSILSFYKLCFRIMLIFWKVLKWVFW